jgi:all-trans-retinol 13,14-reductase
MEEPAYIIVGSGLAGLTFAALMAKSGRRVLVLEAHDKPGGYAHTFDIGPYRFNAQLHYVWNVGPGRTVDRVLHRLALADEVPFVRLDPEGYDHMRIPGHALDIPCSFEVLAERLGALFPRHASALAGFVAEVRETDAELDALPSRVSDLGRLLRAHGYRRVVRYRSATLQHVFDRFALPLEAQALIALQWPDFMLPPDQLSFFAWVKLFGGYARGAYYPKRHFHDVVDALVRVITTHGGSVRLRSRVAGFVFDGAKVRGVRLDADSAAPGDGEVVTGGAVVCNMDPQRAARMIGFERFSPEVRRRLQYEYSASNFVAYCAVTGLDLRAHGFGAWNVFHSDTPGLNAAFAAMHDRDDYSRVSFAMSTPTLVSDAPGIAPAGHQVLELLTVASHPRFLERKLSDPAGYRAMKHRVFDAMIDVVARDYVPAIRDHIAAKVLGSPTTSERYVRAPEGNSYGSAMTPRNVGARRLGHRTSIAALHFCNASSGYPGFAGSFWTGARLYEHLTGDRFLR